MTQICLHSSGFHIFFNYILACNVDISLVRKITIHFVNHCFTLFCLTLLATGVEGPLTDCLGGEYWLLEVDDNTLMLL